MVHPFDTTNQLAAAFVDIDEYSSIAYLEVPKNSVVLLQVFFELYDGVGAVRTVQIPQEKGAATGGIVCILTTPGQKPACVGLLHSLRERVPWRITTCSEDPFLLHAQRSGF